MTTNNSMDGENATRSNSRSDGTFSASLVLQVSAFCVVLLVSLIGNSLVILIIKKDNDLKKMVMSATIFHMATADLIMTGVGLPSMILRILYQGAWLIDGTLGLVVCKTHSFLIEVSVAVSGVSIAVIALERFLSVFFPLRKILTTKSAHAIGFFVWVSSCAFYSPKLYTATVFHYGRIAVCKNNLGQIKPWRKIETVCFVVLFVVTLIMYVAIVVKVRRNRVPGRIVSEASQLARIKTNRRVLRQGLGVITTHYLCWFPYLGFAVSCILVGSGPAMCKQANIFNTFVMYFLGFSTAALNPIMYAATNKSFRQGWKTIFRNTCIPCRTQITPVTGSTRFRFSAAWSSQKHAKPDKCTHQRAVLKEKDEMSDISHSPEKQELEFRAGEAPSPLASSSN